jgi:hypothetical protein
LRFEETAVKIKTKVKAAGIMKNQHDTLKAVVQK